MKRIVTTTGQIIVVKLKDSARDKEFNNYLQTAKAELDDSILQMGIDPALLGNNNGKSTHCSK